MSAELTGAIPLNMPARAWRSWAAVAKSSPAMVATMQTYLTDLAQRLDPTSVAAAEVCLRQFALHLVAAADGSVSLDDVDAERVAGFAAALERGLVPEQTGPVSAKTAAYKLDTLRRFFERINAADAGDVTVRVVPIAGRQRRPKKLRPPGPGQPQPEVSWADIAAAAPQMAATMTAYLDQITVSLRPASVVSASLALRLFAGHIVSTDPDCGSVSAISRAHIESYKLAAAARPGQRTQRSSPQTVRHKLGQIRTFFERIIDWDWDDAPRRVPIFAGDIPKADEPLPKFLDDPTAAKFMATLATDPNRRRRLMVELLALTGMRAGEVAGLRDDAVFRLRDRWWLRIPVGKLHNDRNVPLHPLLVGMINDYQDWRGPSPSGLLLERDDGRPFDRRTIARYVERAGQRAGVGHVHPHQLRHTLATQCLNRGMSLEAIAALLGHRSPRMTLVYSRISDTNVADQYFRATEAVEAKASQPTGGDYEARQAAQEHRRLLGNGHCTRPLELDCRFQTICEGCGFFETGPDFIDIIRDQRDNATAHADLERTRLYDELIRVIDAGLPES